MKPIFVIISAFFIIGLSACATPASDFNRAKEIQLKNNWGKLSKGMSVDEVDSLIGPLNRGAVISIRNMADKAKASSGASHHQQAGGNFPYSDHFFRLIFDGNGRLSEWSLK